MAALSPALVRRVQRDRRISRTRTVRVNAAAAVARPRRKRVLGRFVDLTRTSPTRT